MNKGFGACLWISVEEDDSWGPHRDLPPNSAGLSPPCSPLQQVAHDKVFRIWIFLIRTVIRIRIGNMYPDLDGMQLAKVM